MRKNETKTNLGVGDGLAVEGEFVVEECRSDSDGHELRGGRDGGLGSGSNRRKSPRSITTCNQSRDRGRR